MLRAHLPSYLPRLCAGFQTATSKHRRFFRALSLLLRNKNSSSCGRGAISTTARYKPLRPKSPSARLAAQLPCPKLKNPCRYLATLGVVHVPISPMLPLVPASRACSCLPVLAPSLQALQHLPSTASPQAFMHAAHVKSQRGYFSHSHSHHCGTSMQWPISHTRTVNDCSI